MNSTIVTCSEMKDIERRAAEGGLSYYQMMEYAGSAAADFIKSKLLIRKKQVVVFCGKGNNGGDGFVVARKLYEKGAVVYVLLVDGEPKTEDAITNKVLCEDIGINFLDIQDLAPDIEFFIKQSDVIVDAIYGTGFHGGLKEEIRRSTKLINDSLRALKFSLDIPSGLNGDDGTADPDTVKAHYTIAFHRYKPAHVMENGKKYCGKIISVDIGINQGYFL